MNKMRKWKMKNGNNYYSEISSLIKATNGKQIKYFNIRFLPLPPLIPSPISISYPIKTGNKSIFKVSFIYYRWQHCCWNKIVGKYSEAEGGF